MNRFCALLLSLLAFAQVLSASACQETISTGTQVSTGITAGGSEVLARVYDAKLGRFLSPDPAIQDPNNLQCYNRYSYCLNNPLIFTDPTGYYTDLYLGPGMIGYTAASNINATNANPCWVPNPLTQAAGAGEQIAHDATSAFGLLTAPTGNAGLSVTGVPFTESTSPVPISSDMQAQFSSDHQGLISGAHSAITETVNNITGTSSGDPDRVLGRAAGAALEVAVATKISVGGSAAEGTLEANSVRSGLSTEVGTARASTATATSPNLNPANFAGRTPSEIATSAQEASLISKGPSPMTGKGAYIDPVTGEQRILIHPDADTPHMHVNAPDGTRLDINSNPVPPESPEAHLPIKPENP